MQTHELTATEQADLETYDRNVRAVLARVLRAMRDSDVETLAVFAAQNVDPILAKLDPDAVIEPAGELAGAKPLTTIDYLDLRDNILRVVLTLKATKMPLLVKTVGINAE